MVAMRGTFGIYILIAGLIAVLAFVASLIALIAANGQNDVFVYAVGIGAVVAMLLAMFVAYRLLRIRQAIDSGMSAILPDEVIDNFGALLNAVASGNSISDQNRNAVVRLQDALSRSHSDLAKTLSEFANAFNVFREELDRKDREIERLTRKNESELALRMIVRFIKVQRWLTEEIEYADGGAIDGKAANAIRRQMDNALTECGVEHFSPSVGEPYESTVGVADSPEIILTSDREKHGKVAEIKQSGYRWATSLNRESDVIQKAIISVYHYQPAGGA